MFSNRRPSLIVPEHLENIDHIAIKLQALAGSIWCILPASRDRTCISDRREGILEGVSCVGRNGEERGETGEI